ncbi:MAG: nuclear transport factor 2 family protein [Spirosomataceae bacterium]
MKTNKEIVQAIYDAFGQANIPFILESVAENFTHFDPSDPAVAPQGGRHSGRAEFLGFFQKLGDSVDTTLWEVDNIIADKEEVVATGKHGVTVKKTGKKGVIEWVMVWHFEGNQPVSIRNYYDTARYEALYQN